MSKKDLEKYRSLGTQEGDAEFKKAKKKFEKVITTTKKKKKKIEIPK